MVLSLLPSKFENRAHPHASFLLSLAPSQRVKQHQLELTTPLAPMNIVLDVVIRALTLTL